MPTSRLMYAIAVVGSMSARMSHALPNAKEVEKMSNDFTGFEDMCYAPHPKQETHFLDDTKCTGRKSDRKRNKANRWR